MGKPPPSPVPSGLDVPRAGLKMQRGDAQRGDAARVPSAHLQLQPEAVGGRGAELRAATCRPLPGRGAGSRAAAGGGTATTPEDARGSSAPPPARSVQGKDAQSIPSCTTRSPVPGRFAHLWAPGHLRRTASCPERPPHAASTPVWPPLSGSRGATTSASPVRHPQQGAAPPQHREGPTCPAIRAFTLAGVLLGTGGRYESLSWALRSISLSSVEFAAPPSSGSAAGFIPVFTSSSRLSN